MDMSLLDLIVALYPTMAIQRRALEGRFLNRTLLSDVIRAPLEVYESMRLAPGIGEKTRGEIAAVITEAVIVLATRSEPDGRENAMLRVGSVFRPPS